MTSSALGLNVKAFLKARGLSVLALSKAIGQKNPTLVRLIAGTTPNPGVFTVLPLARYMGVSLEDLITKELTFEPTTFADQKKQTALNKNISTLNKKAWDAATKGKLDEVKKLIAEGSNLLTLKRVQLRQLSNNLAEDSLLHMVVKKGLQTLVEFIISKGANVDVRNRLEQTPFHWACYNGEFEIAKILLDAGADITARDIEGDAPFTWAASAGQMEIVKHLLKIGVDVEAQNYSGNTALHWTAIKGNAEMFEYLLSLKLDPTQKNQEGETPISLAKESGHLEIIKIFEKKNK